MVTICITSLTFNNSTFCPQSVFMCFVWISEQTAIISLYNINWLVYITETECLLRGTDWVFMNNKVNHSLWRTMSWLRRLVAGLSPLRIGFEARSAHVSFMVVGQVFLPVPRLTPVSIVPPMLHTHLHPHVAVARRKSGRSLGTLLKSTPVWAIGEHWIEKYYYLVFKG